MPIEVVHIQIDKKVEAMENLKLEVPITVADNANATGEVFECKLRFRGPKGGEFGEPIPLKIKVVERQQQAKAEESKEEPPKALEQVELVKMAVKLFDALKLG
jgi:ribosome assembly protein YihI (activator of Der GTPase)